MIKFLDIKHVDASRLGAFFALLLSVGLALSMSGCATAPPIQKTYAVQGSSVKYGGLCFIGKDSELSEKFKYTKDLVFSHQCRDAYRDFFMRNKNELTRIKLTEKLIGDHDTGYVLTLTFNDEKVSVERIRDTYKTVIHLAGSITIFDFREKMLVASYPRIWEIVHATDHSPSDDEIKAILKSHEYGLTSSFFTQPLLKIFPDVAVLAANADTIQIKNCTVQNEAKQMMTSTADTGDFSRTDWIANIVGSSLSSKLGIPIVPYQKDVRFKNISCCFADSSVSNFKINPGTYGLDISIDQLKKVLAKESRVEYLWLYGAYMTAKLYEPEFNITYYEGAVKEGVFKKIPVTQTDTDDSAGYQGALRATADVAVDTLWENKKSREVILKCQK